MAGARLTKHVGAIGKRLLTATQSDWIPLAGVEVLKSTGGLLTIFLPSGEATVLGRSYTVAIAIV